MSTIVFDLDGTLADTAGDLIESANATFRQLGFGNVLDAEKDQKVAMQGGGRAMLRYGFDHLGIDRSDAEIEELYPVLTEAYAGALCVHSTLYPGCLAALTRLQGAGHQLAVCTNKPGRLAVPLLAELGIDHFFGSVVAADTLAVRKPHPEPFVTCVSQVGGNLHQSLLIGDSVTDRETARAAGVPSILVTFGPIKEAVCDLEPEALLHSYDDLDGIVDSILGSAAT